ncbi:EcoRII N-terminal effector-binding domain-containing protein [Roseovarius sp. Pro17]|uniref:EcoRII N-terminal effector-binding domain-containing protein n=1 Tax=Roseovarius sp. Pro17 TaxID=3108175 RepID=UPI002D76DBAC|nr:EcoRII N-terminal effector-binding domain-containing protein [Roseovarius sp. Pro17]
MTGHVFSKMLSANDVGTTGGHQAGILVPKGEKELLAILPQLDPEIKNPDAWLECVDDAEQALRFRFVYYNNKLHDENGTRNEFRVTHMTKWFRDNGARAGDEFMISLMPDEKRYSIRIVRPDLDDKSDEDGVRIRLSGWRRVH